MQTVVVSATNLFLGGPLTVARELVAALRASEPFERGQLRVIVFCHRRELYADIPAHPNLEWIEKPHVRRNWLVRVFYEYCWFRLWSRRRQVDLWISMQDLTPNVRAAHRVVYCHNAAPFYKERTRWLLDPRFEIFRLLYGFFYRLNLGKNDYAVVQQQWMRDELAARYGRAKSRTIVAHPVASTNDGPEPAPRVPGAPLRLLYPVLPRSAKNHELLIVAMRDLRDLPIELTLTFTGDETRYARKIRRMAEGLENVRFTGFLPLDELQAEYDRADALVFPSKLESWGLPLSEFRRFGRPILAAALPYSREALGGYPRSVFFDPQSPAELAGLLRAYCESGQLPYETRPPNTTPPFAADWTSLVSMLLARTIAPWT